MKGNRPEASQGITCPNGSPTLQQRHTHEHIQTHRAWVWEPETQMIAHFSLQPCDLERAPQPVPASVSLSIREGYRHPLTGAVTRIKPYTTFKPLSQCLTHTGHSINAGFLLSLSTQDPHPKPHRKESRMKRIQHISRSYPGIKTSPYQEEDEDLLATISVPRVTIYRDLHTTTSHPAAKIKQCLLKTLDPINALISSTGAGVS